MSMLEQFRAARRANAPIVAINTPDPASTIATIKVVYNASALAQWNIIDGVTSMNDSARVAVNNLNGGEEASVISGNPIEALRRAASFIPSSGILFFHNAHFFAETTPTDSHKPVIQAIWNLRDPWKNTSRTLVLLAPSIQIPMELRNDVVIIDEPLPTDKELTAIVTKGLSRGGSKKLAKKMVAKLVDAVAGLASFNAEQVIAMSVNLKNKKPDMEQVWEQKIKIIEQARGLKVYRHGATFSEIGGNDSIKGVLRKIAKGKRSPRLIVFLDEIEKSMQAAGTDTSGTTTDQLKVLLTEMQDNDWTGTIIYGFAGTGKSELAKAFGKEAECPVVEADLGGMKNMWVGSSEANMRGFIKTIKGMSAGGNVFFIATCNGIAQLRPEFRRRFRKGIWFCDLPAQHERNKIWDIYFNKFGISDRVKPVDDGWTGAEIRLCCENAHEYGISLAEAAKFMTITSQAMGEEVEAMRKAASGKFIDAQNPGVYHYKPAKQGLMQKLMGPENHKPTKGE
jgi:ATPase family associated with various cellular activities (AAA)